MEIPQSLRTLDRQGAVVRTVDYDDESVIAVDFGTEDSDLAVDVVGDAVIVVSDEHQLEFELPPGATEVTVKNGVLTITE